MLSRLFLFSFLLMAWAVFLAFFPLWIAVFMGSLATAFWLLLNMYPDKFLLHYLQAREIIETDHPLAYRVARAQAYKFKILTPRIYSYSGFFHRAFAFAARDRLAFVVERKILAKASEIELEALFFALSLQAFEKVARRHTMALLVLAVAWSPALKLLSARKRQSPALSWLIQFLVAPTASLLFKFTNSATAWRSFLRKLETFIWENARLRELNAQLDQPRLEDSPSRTFNFRFYAANHSAAQQMILAIESASHPFDILQSVSMGTENA